MSIAPSSPNHSPSFSSSATTALVPASTAHNSSGAIRLHQLPDDAIISIMTFLANSHASWDDHGSADLARLSRVNKSLNTHIKRHEFKLSHFLANPIPDADPTRKEFAALVRTLTLDDYGISNARARCAKIIHAVPNVQYLNCSNSLEAAAMVQLQHVTQLNYPSPYTFHHLIHLTHEEEENKEDKRRALSFLARLTSLKFDHLPLHIHGNLPALLPGLQKLQISAENRHPASLRHFPHIQQLVIIDSLFIGALTLRPSNLLEMRQLRELSIDTSLPLPSSTTFQGPFDVASNFCDVLTRLPERPRLILEKGIGDRNISEAFSDMYHTILTMRRLIIQSTDFYLAPLKILQETTEFDFKEPPTHRQITALCAWNRALKVTLPVNSSTTKLAAVDLKKKRPDFTVSYFELSEQKFKKIPLEEAAGIDANK